MSPETRPRLGIVVPTLNESEHLPALLDDLERLPVPRRTVVVDGGSSDGTIRLSRRRGVEVVHARRGRASQLRAGSAALGTPWLLFLHADVRLPPEALRALGRWFEDPDPDVAAVFRFRLAGRRWFWRFIEFGQRLRERLTGLAYGDQGLLVSRALYEEVGGYPDLPIMEDVELVRRIRRSHDVRRLQAPLLSSPRRYEREGPWRAWLRNALLLGLYLAGVPARRLARWYRPEPGPVTGAAGPARGATGSATETAERTRTLLVFAKAPVPGRVKTRLAASVGPEEACRIYRRLGRRVVDQVRGGAYRTVLCYDPPEEERTVRRWLGDDGLEFRPQDEGSLGERMEGAFRRAFRRSERVCIVGTDAPDVDRETVERAFRALDAADVALGPAADGGYYLLALRTHEPTLFEDVPWSTPRVLGETLERAGRAGLRVRLLPERDDIDTLEDLHGLDPDASPLRPGPADR